MKQGHGGPEVELVRDAPAGGLQRAMAHRRGREHLGLTLPPHGRGGLGQARACALQSSEYVSDISFLPLAGLVLLACLLALTCVYR